MTPIFIDTHAHLDGEEFADDLPEVIARAHEHGVEKIFVPNVNATSLGRVTRICSQYPDTLYPMIGLHPEDVRPDYQAVLDGMEKHLAGGHPFIGIGEVGLDFYWDSTYAKEQVETFRMQVEWALHYHLPLMIHARSAHRQLVEVLNDYRSSDLTGVFHCFTGTTDEARGLLAFQGFMLGIGGVLTFKKSALPAVLREAVPLQRIVLETDAPYMTPVPYRGKRNESAFIPLVAQKMAEVFDISIEEVAQTTTRNAQTLFGRAASRS